MTNVDDMLKKMLGKTKGKPVSRPFNNMQMPKMIMPQAMLQRKGASIPMQKQWKSFSKPKQIMLRKRFKDSDGDGVPNRWDCQPHNRFKQDDKEVSEDELFDYTQKLLDDVEESPEWADIQAKEEAERIMKETKEAESWRRHNYEYDIANIHNKMKLKQKREEMKEIKKAQKEYAEEHKNTNPSVIYGERVMSFKRGEYSKR